MLNDKLNHIENCRVVWEGDDFMLKYTRRSKITLESYLKQFNLDDYYILKATENQRLITNEELIEFKHSGYLFFLKEKYDINQINLWLEWLKNNGGIKYLSKPLPPFNPNKNIIFR